MLPADDTTTLARLFHLNSGPMIRLDGSPDPPYEFRYKEVGDFARELRLPRPQGEQVMRQLQSKRRSCRAYAERDMPVENVSRLLGATYALVENGPAFQRRTTPSAGGLYPLELYLVLQRIRGVPDGLYHYDVRAHGLEPMRSGQLFEALRACMAEQDFFVAANVVAIFSAVFERTLKKYGPRGYRYILFEAGHAAQNLCLVAAELGLGSLPLGGFLDSRLNAFLGLDGLAEAALYGVAVGYPLE